MPEIHDGLINIRAVARIPGERAKIAVESYDDRIDPVGACVGVKGSRIHGIVRELRNGNIDVIAIPATRRCLSSEHFACKNLDNPSCWGSQKAEFLGEDYLACMLLAYLRRGRHQQASSAKSGLGFSKRRRRALQMVLEDLNIALRLCRGWYSRSCSRLRWLAHDAK